MGVGSELMSPVHQLKTTGTAVQTKKVIRWSYTDNFPFLKGSLYSVLENRKSFCSSGLNLCGIEEIGGAENQPVHC